MVTDTNGLPWFAECRGYPYFNCNIEYLTGSGVSWTAHALPGPAVVSNLAVGNACINSNNATNCNDGNIYVQYGNSVLQYSDSTGQFGQMNFNHTFSNITELTALPMTDTGGTCTLDELLIWDQGPAQLYSFVQDTGYCGLRSCSCAINMSATPTAIAPPSGGMGILSAEFLSNSSGVWQFQANQSWSQVGSACLSPQVWFGGNNGPGGSLWCETSNPADNGEVMILSPTPGGI